jgi:electron transport complex protein RnfG
VVKTAGQGYSDKVELLLGLDPTFTKITGLFILEQKETPGLGNKMIFPEWRGQFIGKPTAPPLKVVKTGAQAKNEIDAITGATISSRSVVSIVNGAVQALREPLAKADGA